MARRVFRRDLWLASLLVLSLSAGRAAAQTPAERAWHSAVAEIEQGRFKRADQIVAGALLRLRESNDRWYWELRVLRGKTLLWSGQAERVAPLLEPELPSALRGTGTDARRLLHLGRATGNRSLSLRAIQIAGRNPDAQAEVYASWAATTEDEALARRAWVVAHERKESYYEALAMNEIAYRLAHREEYVEAVHWWEALLALAREKHFDVYIERAQGNLGWMFVELGDLETAAELFETALPIAARLEVTRDILAWTNQRGNVALQLRDYGTAEKFCISAVRIGGFRASPEVGHALANLARVAIAMGRPDAAQCYNDAALAAKQFVDDRPGVERSRIVNAQIAVLRGRPDEAKRLLMSIVAKASEASVKWEARGALARLLRAAGRDRDAENQFRDAIATVRAARESIDDPTLRLAFFRVAEDVFDEYVDFLMDRGRNDDALAAAASIRAQTLEEELGVHGKADPRALARGRQATILYYWLGHARSYVWVITGTAVTPIVLPPENEIETRVEAYQRAILDPATRIDATRGAGEQLYAMLVAPAAIASGSKVIVIPDGRLHVLNMESLIVPGPRLRYWIEDVTLANASSLQLLGRPPSRDAGRGAMLLVGDPRQADATYPPLGNAKLELDKVRSHFAQPVVLTEDDATPASFRAASPEKFAYLHFVAHGEATRRRPLDAAVILGRDSTGAYKLFARDIGEHLTARLVTVSSCYGAGTRAFVGEGLVGLAWAFLRAGARQVVAALWEVSDTTTPDLMDAMYAGIAAGKDPATALRDAKLKYVRSDNIYCKPFYWAPFVLYGGT